MIELPGTPDQPTPLTPSIPPILPTPPPDSWLDLGVYMAGGFGGYLLVSLILGLTLRQWISTMSIGVSVALYATNFLCLGGAVYLLGIRRRKFTWADLGLWPPKWRWSWPLLAVGLTVVFLPVRGMLGLLVQMAAGGGMQSLQNRMQIFAPNAQFSWLDFAVTFIGAGLLAPVAEELYFRGLIHRALRPRFRFWLRVVLSTSFFALAHFDSAGVVASSFVLGMVNAVAFELSDSLWLPIMVHVFNNSLAVVLVYVAIAVGPLLQKSGFM
jgi:membrane protease YdiL (CAAX protease family)